MHRYLDLTGQRFGYLLVLKYHHSTEQGDACWLCQRERCNNMKVITRRHLVVGDIKSCGCANHLRKEITWDVDQATGCWNCNSHGCDTCGYPSTHYGNTTEHISRIMFKRAHGELPANVSVCHRCDNPKCINPEHLFLGTHLDNMRDMSNKGRSARGERSGIAKLNEAQVLRIFKDNIYSYSELAEQYGISSGAISGIKDGSRWRHLTLPFTDPKFDPNHDPYPIILSGETVFNDGGDPEVFSCEWSSDDYLKELGYVKDE